MGGTLKELLWKTPIVGQWVDDFYTRESEASIRRTKGYGSIKADTTQTRKLKHLVHGYWTLQNTRVLGQGAGLGVYKVQNLDTGYVTTLSIEQFQFGIEELLNDFAPVENNNRDDAIEKKKQGYQYYQTQAALRRFFNLPASYDFETPQNAPYEVTTVMELETDEASEVYELNPLDKARWLPILVFCYKNHLKKRCFTSVPDHRAKGWLDSYIRVMIGDSYKTLYMARQPWQVRVDERRFKIDEMVRYKF